MQSETDYLLHEALQFSGKLCPFYKTALCIKYNVFFLLNALKNNKITCLVRLLTLSSWVRFFTRTIMCGLNSNFWTDTN